MIIRTKNGIGLRILKIGADLEGKLFIDIESLSNGVKMRYWDFMLPDLAKSLPIEEK
jgi:hypothetical protein